MSQHDGGEGGRVGGGGEDGGVEGEVAKQIVTLTKSRDFPAGMAVVGSSLTVLKSVVPMVSVLVRASLVAPAGTSKRHQAFE